MVAELTSITAAVGSNNSHKSASSAGGRSVQLARWIQTATKPNIHSYSCSSEQPMYSSVCKTSGRHKNENETSGRRYWNDIAGNAVTDPAGLLSRQGPGRGVVGLVGPYRASSDRLDAMEEREGGVDDDGGGGPRATRRGSEGNCVGVGVGVSGVGSERRVFMLRDEELVEENDSHERSAQNSRNRSQDNDNRVLDVSPTPGRENWRLRESKSTTGEQCGGAEERRGMSMTDIWPKDWGGKYFCSYVYR